jgi:hypothetical protein
MSSSLRGCLKSADYSSNSPPTLGHCVHISLEYPQNTHSAPLLTRVGFLQLGVGKTRETRWQGGQGRFDKENIGFSVRVNFFNRTLAVRFSLLVYFPSLSSLSCLHRESKKPTPVSCPPYPPILGGISGCFAVGQGGFRGLHSLERGQIILVCTRQPTLGGTRVESPPELGDLGGRSPPELGDLGGRSPPELGDLGGRSPPELEDLGGRSSPELGDLGG